MALNAPLLRSSFEVVIEREPQLTEVFYSKLFEHSPDLKSLFTRNTPRVQSEMLAGALVAVLDHLEDAPWLINTLGALGAKHAEYGVTEEMYEPVGTCLLATLEEVAGNAWSDEVSAAWGDAYGAIRELMLAGASRSAKASS